MKSFCLILITLTVFTGFSQSLPINFEGDITTADFVNFDGGTAIVTTNPMPSGINTSSSVARIIRDGEAAWAGSKILLTDNLDFSVLTKISMKVYTTAPVGTTVKFKLEGTGSSVDVDATTTVSGTWETLEWIFVGTSNDLNEIVFMFDIGNVGDGTATSIFLFDDVQQEVGPAIPDPRPTTLPVDFENSVVTTDFTNFFGSVASVIPNPHINANNPSGTVGKFVRSGGAGYARSKLALTDFIENMAAFGTFFEP